MEIIAQTKNDYLIQATEKELGAIINSVSGMTPDKILIGQKVPAIDYASTISKVKKLKDEYIFKSMMSKIEELYGYAKGLEDTVSKAADLE